MKLKSKWAVALPRLVLHLQNSDTPETMATRKETVRVCDQCGKEKRFETDGGYCGGHPLQGWVHVSEHGGSTRLAELERKKEHDYCSWKCLAESLQNGQAQSLQLG